MGGEICSTFDHPELVKLGKCDLIEEIMVGEDKMIRFSGVPAGAACSIVLRGASGHVLGEADRSLHDALAVLSQMAASPRIVYGGGCSESLMAHAIDLQVPSTEGKNSKRRRSNVAVIIVKIVFISSFFFYCLLLNHSF